MEKHIPGPVREKIIVAHYRYTEGGEGALEDVDKVCKLCRSTNYVPGSPKPKKVRIDKERSDSSISPTTTTNNSSTCRFAPRHAVRVQAFLPSQTPSSLRRLHPLPSPPRRCLPSFLLLPRSQPQERQALPPGFDGLRGALLLHRQDEGGREGNEGDC